MHHHPVLKATDGEPSALAAGGQAVARPLQVSVSARAALPDWVGLCCFFAWDRLRSARLT